MVLRSPGRAVSARTGAHPDPPLRHTKKPGMCRAAGGGVIKAGISFAALAGLRWLRGGLAKHARDCVNSGALICYANWSARTGVLIRIRPFTIRKSPAFAGLSCGAGMSFAALAGLRWLCQLRLERGFLSGSAPSPYEKARHLPGFFVWRRGRDSNPGTCYSQRFSRPPLSTTQPPLRIVWRIIPVDLLGTSGLTIFLGTSMG